MTTRARKRIPCFALGAIALLALGACHDDGVAPRRSVPPIDQMTDLGSYVVEVNVKTGQILTHPLDGAIAAPPGVDAAFFGAAGTISHTFQLEGGAPSAGNTYTLDDHIENVFAYPIGTHLPHTTGVFPEDTMGVYVYISIPPTVTAGCTPSATCKVAADSGYDGAYTFTSATPQPYMFFKTILEASDGTPHKGLDYTDQSPANGGTGINYFRSLSFRASPGVTNFKFGVAVRAAIVKPNENRWLVTYVADSLPNRVGTSLADLRSEPDWRVHGSAGAVVDTSIVTSGCTTGAARCFRIESTTPTTSVPADSITYFRSDSLGTTDSAYVATTVAVSNLRPSPSVFFGMQDRVKQILVGLSSNRVGFCDATNSFIPGGAVAAGTAQNWRVAKFGADSAVIYGNGTRLVKIAYASLPAAPAGPLPRPFFFFGNRALNGHPNPTLPTSEWTSLTYEIGATSP